MWSDDYIRVVSELQRGRKGSGRRKVGNNTYLVERPEGAVWAYGDPVALKLHATDILTYDPDGITYNSGGWQTVTTKQRMNAYGPIRISQERYVWYVKVGVDWKGTLYADGMRVSYDGDILNGNEPSADALTERDATDKAIRKYARLCADSLPLPNPDGGDCWGCYFRAEDATVEAMGTDHYAEHFTEGYVVPSLVWNAVRARGYGDPSVIWHMMQAHPDSWRNDTARMVRKYLWNRLNVQRSAEPLSSGF